jgi:ribosomal RNA-processing protein 12
MFPPLLSLSIIAHTLQIWPSLTTHLLALPRLGNPYLSQSAYSLLSALLTTPPSATALDPETVDLTAQLPLILKAVLSSPPARTDNALAPAWLLLLGHTIRTLALADASACAAELPKAWKAAWAFLDNGDGAIRAPAAQALGLLAHAFPPAFVAAALPDAPAIAAGADDAQSPLGKIVLQTARAFSQLSFAPAVPELLAVVASLVSALPPTAAETLLGPLIDQIAALRTARAFEHKEAVDAVLAAALGALGADVLLARLPLALEPADRAAGAQPRAFLLPLLPAPHPGPLAHFVGYFVPLSERLFELQSAAEGAGRAAEAKVWSVLIGQVWAGLVGYCHVTSDLPEVGALFPSSM